MTILRVCVLINGWLFPGIPVKKTAKSVKRRRREKNGFAELLTGARQVIRTKITGLTPAARSRIARSGICQQTHFYAWMRGDDRALSLETLDAILADLRWDLIVGCDGEIHCE